MKFIVFTILAVLSTSSVFASDDGKVWVTPSSLGHVYTPHEDSAQDREDKKFIIIGQPVGIGASPGLGMSEALDLGVYLTKNSILSIEGGHLSSYGSDSLFWGASYNVDMTTWGVNYKQFFGNSFYVKGGFDYFLASANAYFTPAWFSNETSGDGYVQGTALAAEVAVGNQWQWSRFTLGCEWGGLVAPLVSNVTHDDISPGAPSSSRDSQNSIKNRIFSSVMFEAVRFYLGMSF